MFNIYKNENELNKEKYFIVKYYLKSSTSLAEASFALAIGQSVGNYKIRNNWETDELFENHSCIVLGNEEQLKTKKQGIVKIAFPVVNINFAEDGISHLLCQIMGGQVDIDNILSCKVKDIVFPDYVTKIYFKGPKFGIKGIREFTKTFDKPLLGGIIKPKIGVSPETLLEMVKELVEGGVNFIKEDEIMSNPSFCKIDDRVPLIMDYIKGKNVIYSVCINADSPYLLERVKKVYELGGNSVHVNFWSGLGSYKAIRELDLPIFLHFQKSGDKILTEKSHRYHIDWDVICKLAGMMGADFIHAGMFGGYLNVTEKELKKTISVLHKYGTMPALSCGMHPGLIDGITKRFGCDYMANVGGAIHGFPSGTRDGTKAMRQAIDNNHDKEYRIAVEKWGKLE